MLYQLYLILATDYYSPTCKENTSYLGGLIGGVVAVFIISMTVIVVIIVVVLALRSHHGHNPTCGIELKYVLIPFQCIYTHLLWHEHISIQTPCPYVYREIKNIQTPGKQSEFDGLDTNRSDYENVSFPASNPYAEGQRGSGIYEEVECKS